MLNSFSLDKIHLDFFSSVLGSRFVLTDEKQKKTYGKDWTKSLQPNPACILLPESTKQVSEILSYCSEQKLKLVPSGGRTGLAGGAVAADCEVILSMERMRNIIEIDPVGLTLTAEAGATTQSLQEAASKAGLLFPIDLAAKGSCQIGGNIATNAGGLKFISFAGTREQVLGLEVVLASGEILNLNRSLYKNNTGYDLKQLFIGSEGTLGIITKATLRLQVQLRCSSLVCLALDSCENILSLLAECHKNYLKISAFEYFDQSALNLVLKMFSDLKNPFDEVYPYYVLLEVESDQKDNEKIERFLEDRFAENIVLDAVLPDSSEQVQKIWGLRENITESLAASGYVRKNDISIPIKNLAIFEIKVQKLISEQKNDLQVIMFGHVGDGNIHINYLGKFEQSYEEFSSQARVIEEKIYAFLAEMDGSISAEHGVGLLKKDDLHFSRSKQEVEYMRKIKKIFDPEGILNPGKIFDLL